MIASYIRSVFFVASLCSLQAEFLTLTDQKSGRTIQAEVLSLIAGELTIKNENGKTFSLPLTRLDSASQQRANEALASQNISDTAHILPEKLNGIIGHPLFSGTRILFEEPVKEIAGRLNWPQESRTLHSSSYRLYPPLSYGFANAHPYSAVLYGNSEGAATRLSLIFANKGDYNSMVGSGEDHFQSRGDHAQRPESLKEAIKQDYDSIQFALSSTLGEATVQRFGETGQRRSVVRWDWNGHAFLLEEEKEEYVSLTVMSEKAADHDGQTARITDTQLREQLLGNIEKRENGDVFLQNIPMVDQGPKGYCAPATFERAMRYMSVPADMYLLATLATAPGGGTNTDLLASEAKRQIRRKARRITDIGLERELKSLRGVKRFIDRGIPILWCMRSVPTYNEIANANTVKRASVTDWTGWASSIATLSAAQQELLQREEAYHICLIIGYNEATDELAVSDSWGPSYALRWVPRAVCQAVTYGDGFVINL